MKDRVEILAPAGSMECLKAAIAAGADAVYTGGALFGARAYAHNLTEEELLEAIDYVIGKIHRARVRIKSNVNFDATLELLIVEARREF
jgi:collagenase-like PrtC family protease